MQVLIIPAVFCLCVCFNREVTEAFTHAVNKMKTELMQALSEGLGLEQNELNEVCGAVQRTYTNFYPPCPQPDVVLGARAHSDPNAVTILLQDDVGGLEVRDLKYREWVPVKTIPHAFIINMGDQMEVLTACHLQFFFFFFLFFSLLLL